MEKNPVQLIINTYFPDISQADLEKYKAQIIELTAKANAFADDQKAELSADFVSQHKADIEAYEIPDFEEIDLSDNSNSKEKDLYCEIAKTKRQMIYMFIALLIIILIIK